MKKNILISIAFFIVWHYRTFSKFYCSVFYERTLLVIKAGIQKISAGVKQLADSLFN